MVALKSFRHSGPSFADLVPYAGLVDNGVILLKDGSLMAGWYFAGPDSESSTDAERNEVSRLGSGWMIQVEAIRVPTGDYPTEAESHFPIRSHAPSTMSDECTFRRRRGISRASTLLS